MPLLLVAGRFVQLADGAWFDLATAGRVWLRRAVVPRHQQLALDEAAARLVTISHPALSSYLDYGAVGADEWFEAAALSPGGPEPVHSDRAELCRVLATIGPCQIGLVAGHGGRLIPSLLAGEEEVLTVESLAPDGEPRYYDALPTPCEPLLDHFEDRVESGLRVWRLGMDRRSHSMVRWPRLARELRLRGYLPVDERVLSSADEVGGPSPAGWLAAADGFTLVIRGSWESPVGSHRLAALLLALGARGVRGVALNVCGAGTRARAFARGAPHRAVVHYPARVHDGGHPPEALSLAAVRGPGVSSRGASSRIRGAAARWKLRRAAGRLSRRGEWTRTLAVWIALALESARARDYRGTAAAWEQAWKAAEAQRSMSPVIDAAPDLASRWLFDLELTRAESLLRSTLEAAEAIGHAAERARILLGEVLWWQGRWRDCLAVVDGIGSAIAHALRARAHLALGDPSRALEDAVGAAAASAPSADVTHISAVIEARLHVALALGDREDVDRRLGQMTALVLRDPIAGALCDLAVADALTVLGIRIPDAPRHRLERLVRSRGPRLVRARARLVLALNRGADPFQLERDVKRVALATGARALMRDARAFPWPWPPTAPAPRSPMLHDIVDVLRACQQESDPAAALNQLCVLLADRTRAAGASVSASVSGASVALARSGRPPQSQLVARAASLMAPIGPEPGASGIEGAWPIRHGDDVVGVLACRWTPPNAPSAESIALLQTAATAMALVVTLARSTRETQAAEPRRDRLIGVSLSMGRVRAAIDRAGPSPFPVLIEGESGAGKELVARAIHASSQRKARRFAALNCAALADDLVEAELFGHARGAFTGAIAERPGLFEEADGGTLFLDEVGELSPRAQAKLLRAIQEGEIRRLGETRPRRVDARIVAATNRPLAVEAEAGRFRSDLRFRLDVIRIELPPLRSRPEDIPQLVDHFWREAAGRVGSRATLARGTVAALAKYQWPGNVRELQNVLSALAVAAPKRGAIGAGALPSGIAPSEADSLTLDQARRQFDVTFVRGALARAGGCRSRAASELGVTRQGLAKLMERLGISVDAALDGESVEA